jgi:hypothetical protein
MKTLVTSAAHGGHAHQNGALRVTLGQAVLLRGGFCFPIRQ